MCELFHSCVHTHTVFCDGADTPQAMAEAALALQFVSLAFPATAPPPMIPPP